MYVGRHWAPIIMHYGCTSLEYARSSVLLLCAMCGMPMSLVFSSGNHQVGPFQKVKYQAWNTSNLGRLSFLVEMCTVPKSFCLWLLAKISVPVHSKRSTGTNLDRITISIPKRRWQRKLLDGWFPIFDVYIGRKAGRKASLLLINCPAHGESDAVPPFHHLKVEFLPPRPTSKIQPFDAGIISWVKTIFCKPLLFRIFDNLGSRVTSIYNFDVLTAI